MNSRIDYNCFCSEEETEWLEESFRQDEIDDENSELIEISKHWCMI